MNIGKLMGKYCNCVEDDLYDAVLVCLRENSVSDALKIVADAVGDYFEED